MSGQEVNTLSIVEVRSPQACRPVNRKFCLVLISPWPRKENCWSPRLLSFPSFVTLVLSLKIHFSHLFVLIAPLSAFSVCRASVKFSQQISFSFSIWWACAVDMFKDELWHFWQNEEHRFCLYLSQSLHGHLSHGFTEHLLHVVSKHDVSHINLAFFLESKQLNWHVVLSSLCSKFEKALLFFDFDCGGVDLLSLWSESRLLLVEQLVLSNDLWTMSRNSPSVVSAVM